MQRTVRKYGLLSFLHPHLNCSLLLYVQLITDASGGNKLKGVTWCCIKYGVNGNNDGNNDSL